MQHPTWTAKAVERSCMFPFSRINICLSHIKNDTSNQRMWIERNYIHISIKQTNLDHFDYICLMTNSARYMTNTRDFKESTKSILKSDNE